MDFRRRYGPWAVVAGASEGLGAAWARALAARGLDLVLVARTEARLREVADAVRAAHGVEVRVAPLDLGAPDAVARLRAHTDGLDVGLLVYDACASPIGTFLSLDPEQREAVIDVNVRGVVRLAAHVGERLVARGSGGIVLMSSLSGFQGTAMVGMYAASKAFDTVLGEALWEELRPHGVDVLVCAAGATSTPRFEAVTPAARRAGTLPMQADAVVAEALGALGRRGPTFVPGRLNRAVHAVLSRLPRRVAVRFLSRQTRRLYEGRT